MEEDLKKKKLLTLERRGRASSFRHMWGIWVWGKAPATSAMMYTIGGQLWL